jgi:hypothetical protein
MQHYPRESKRKFWGIKCFDLELPLGHIIAKLKEPNPMRIL